MEKESKEIRNDPNLESEDEITETSSVSVDETEDETNKEGKTSIKKFFSRIVSGFKSPKHQSLEPQEKKKKNWKQRSAIERVLTVIPAVIMLVIMLVAQWQMTAESKYTIEFWLSLILICTATIVGIFCVRLGKVWGWIVTALTPAVSFLLTEFMIRNPFIDGKGINSVGLFVSNLILFYGFAALLLFVTGSMKVCVVGITGLPMLYTIANHYVWKFRDAPLFPWDFASAGTAADVADNYQFIIDWHVCFIACSFLFIILLGFLCTPRIKLSMWWLRVPASILAAASLVITGSYVQSDKGVSELGMYPYLFTPNYVYWRNGAAVSLAYTSQYMNIQKPDGYSIKKLNETISGYSSDPYDSSKELPNVIVIMNEAFSDLTTASNYTQNRPVTPFIDSLTENTVKGTAHVSVKGGNTANSEFEFLTGLSMAQLTPGCIPYQQYIKGETPSFVSQLAELGYDTMGMHPYPASGWNRDNVYDWFGFENTYFKEFFDKYPERYGKLRGYYSDDATYRLIRETFRAKTDDSPLFIFDVTMQNHGGYTYKDAYKKTFPINEIYASGMPRTGVTNTYLALIKKSDEAFEKLVAFFEESDDPTIILMFGDHQPNDNVVTPLWKKNGESVEVGTLDEQLRRYTVPFVMWANYDIEEETDVHTSLNFMSTLLCEKAGVPKTAFQNYLADLSSEYPVITAGHYSDANGNYYDATTLSQIDAVNEYAMFGYNLLADRKHMVTSVFSYGYND